MPVPFPAADQPGVDNEGYLIPVEKMDRLLEQQTIASKIINLKVTYNLLATDPFSDYALAQIGAQVMLITVKLLRLAMHTR